ncbi:MAG: glycosyltransferase [Oscillospiraceae bacterium]|nr:glycosyltransferase [Oscillospiraceae bacterium]
MKKKVLHIGTSGGRGGIETFILNVSSYMDKSQYDFSIVADCENAIIEEDFKKIGDVIYIPAITKNKLGYLKGIWCTIDKNKFDIVHIHKNSLSNPFPILICKIKGIKNVILHSHNTMPANGGASVLIHKIFRKVLNIFSIKRIACSKLAAEWMFGSNSNKDIVVLKNGVDTDKLKFDKIIRQRKRYELGIDYEGLAICSVGRLSEQKNTMFILKIFEEICIRKDDVHLFLIGNGPLKEKAQAYAASSKYCTQIHFLGIRQDIPNFLQGMDLFLMPSLYEGLPIAAIEAQAASLPLLISDTVDSDVKILDSTEFENLNSSAEDWAIHCLELVEKNERKDVSEKIYQSGYDLKKTALALTKLYCN